MARQQKTGTIKAFQIRDPNNLVVMRDTTGKVVTIQAYTPKAAKHQAKAMFGGSVLVELRN